MKRGKIAAAAIIGVAALYAIYSAGYQRGHTSALLRERRVVDFRGSAAQIDDAIARWGAKNHQSQADVLKAHYPKVTYFPAKNCVELELEWGWAGGSPIYCYKPNTRQLIEEYSDVE
ncbi:hypothetical protein [Sphingobium lactosutens]|uniref:hypothetical protein n=1 Tax=Sphingobium lactosutens TaxID=522773 RepID=UPI0015B7FB56|nr:hypothetical protein [Sphingobium lactosutens]